MDQFGQQPPSGEPQQPSAAQFVAPMSEPELVESTPARSRSRVGTGIAIAAVAIGALGLGGVAYAATTNSSTPSPSASGKPGYNAPAQPGNGYAPRQGGGVPGGMMGGDRGGMGMRGGLGFGLGGAIHGTAVVPKQGGGYQTVDAQRGTVTAVSSTSITVNSDDGFTATYVVTADTLVNAKRDGIASIKKDDKVAVIGVEAAGAVNAVQIIDQSQLKAGWQQWLPGQKKNGQNGPTGTNGTAPSGSSTGTA